MSQTAGEPSMEDILASIKKIIADDSVQTLAPAPAPRRQSARPANFDDLAQPVAAQSEEAADEDGDSEEVLELNQPLPRAEAAAEDAGPIISSDALAAARSSLGALSAAAAKPEPAPATVGETTIEGLVREMLKPMLREWLDAHLPAIVERIVAQEVARISGREA